jgi:hypothetical protein
LTQWLFLENYLRKHGVVFTIQYVYVENCQFAMMKNSKPRIAAEKKKEPRHKPVWVDPETHKKVKLLSVLKEKQMKELIDEWATAELKK